MEVATRLFADKGYHGTTVGDICDELGVGKGVFYWYFDSKEALFEELLKSALYHLRRAQQSAIENVDDPVERIARGIRASIEYFRGQPAILALLRTAARYERFSHDLDRGQDVVVADTALHIKAGMADGLIRHGDPDLMAHGILGAILHFVETYFGTDAGAVEYRPQLADEAVTFCLRGVLADPRRA